MPTRRKADSCGMTGLLEACARAKRGRSGAAPVQKESLTGKFAAVGFGAGAAGRPFLSLGFGLGEATL
jgi:hypothetical protein